MEDTNEQSSLEWTITTPKHLRSSVWKYFGFYATDGKVTNKDKAVCRLCTKQLSYSTTTTNLRNHLLACHPNEAADAPQTSGATSHTTSAHSASAGPLPMPIYKVCVSCRQKIGVAAKTCQHCRAKQPYKVKLQQAKKKINDEWKDTQAKNHSINKIYDSTNLLLHKWKMLERHPLFLMGKRVGQRFVAECLCPHEMNTAQEQKALLNIQRIYESLLNDGWCEPLDEESLNEEDREHNGLALDDTEATYSEEEENGEESAQSNERKYGQREIRTETGNSPVPLSPPATSSQDIKRETEDTGSTSNHTQSSDMVEAPSCQPSMNCDLDTMDLDQLRREKIKMQIKVLRLQEEYYTQKIKKQKT